MSLDILLVDDGAAVIVTLADQLRAAGYRLVSVIDGREAMATLGAARFDAMIVGGIGDVDILLRKLRSGGITLPVVVIGVAASPGDCVAVLRAGADDYLPASAGTTELEARLAAVLRGRRWASGPADTLDAGDIVVAPASFRAWRAGRSLDLPRLELALLIELARNADRVMTRAVLIERVWGYAEPPATNILDVHVRRLRRKLTAGGGDDPITTMRGIGYMLRS